MPADKIQGEINDTLLLKKQKIEERLLRIANLLLLNASFIDNLGLLNGKMGIAIFLYHYAKYSSNKIFCDYADELIDEIYEEINTNTPVDFYNGITGIGWGIDFLIKNGFLEADPEKVLKDIDRAIYKYMLKGLKDDSLPGCLIYLLVRVKSRKLINIKEKINKKETLLSLLKECEALLINLKYNGLTNFPDLNTLKAIKCFLSGIEDMDFFKGNTRKLLDLIPSLIKIADVNKKNEKESIIDIATDLNIELLIYPSDSTLNIEVPFLFDEVFKFIDNEENWNTFLKNFRNHLGLNKGLAGIGMSLIRLLAEINSKEDHDTGVRNLNIKQAQDLFSVFIFKSSTRGMRYGIGTYVKEITNSLLKYTDISIFLVNFNSDFVEFKISNIENRFTQIHIPSANLQSNTISKKQKYAKRIIDLLSETISSSEKVVFQVNYLDCLPFVKEIKTRYTFPIVSVVHSAQWQFYFNGNIQKFHDAWTNNTISNEYLVKLLLEEKELYDLSDKIISVTKYMKEYIIQYFKIPNEKISVVQNGVSTSSFLLLNDEDKNKAKQLLGFSTDEKIVLFSGRLDPSKGLYFLLDSFTEIVKRNKKIRLVIIGEDSGPVKICQYLAHCENIWSNVTFTGFLEFKKVLQFYQIADIGIIPSIYDHCPYVALEMIGHNIPIIISNTNGLNEILTNMQSIYLPQHIDSSGNISFNTQEITEAILTICNDLDIAQNLSKDYQYLIKTKFSDQRMAVESYSVMKSLLGSSIEMQKTLLL